jgi:hypothetical protein
MTVRNHKALLALVSARMNTPADFTTQDCVRFANDAAVATAGRDVLAELGVKPTWKTPAGAAKAIAKAGGLAAALDRVLAAIAPASAQRGDIVIIQSPTGPAVGVMLGAVIVAPGVNGLLHLPRKEALAAWSLG